jgi:hypothetical protein
MLPREGRARTPFHAVRRQINQLPGCHVAPKTADSGLRMMTSHSRRNYTVVYDALLRPETPSKLISLRTKRDRIKERPKRDYCGKCPICHEPFGLENIVLLSCGHNIHSSCLLSFRRFARSKIHKCPVCQREYEFLKLKAEKEFYNRSALTIQRVFRGYLVRRRTREFASPGSCLYRRWIMCRAEKASTRLASAIEGQSDAVDAVLATVDRELDWARSIMKSVRERERVVDWKMVKGTVMCKPSWNCAICLKDIAIDDGVVTSCCHVFHRNCLSSWIQFCRNARTNTACPFCRSAFQHRPLCEEIQFPRLMATVDNYT